MTRSRSMVRKTRLCLLFSLSNNLWEKRTILPNFSLACSSSSSCSHHRSIEPAAVKFFTFRFCDEDDDDVNDDVTVRANARRVLLRGRMINWFLSICFFYAL